MRKYFLFLMIGLHLYAANYQFEGVYKEPDGEMRFFLVQCFIPYNPNILVLGPDGKTTCSYWWPKGTVFTEISKGQSYDFIWIESQGTELESLQDKADVVQKAKAIYTSTHFFDGGAYYASLKFFLEMSGYILLSHWYWEGEQGAAIFLKKDIFDAAMRTLNCSSQPLQIINTPSSYDLDRFFRKVKDKPKHHTMDEIDFIYMINLDERPEKFARASCGLEFYGISPYRFPAVNGWTLPFAAFQELGVKFPKTTLKEQFMGSLYHEIDGTQYRDSQIIKEDGRAYFSMGLSEGSIGIVLSHLSVLQDAYDCGYQTIWVMEDDVDVLDDPNQLSTKIRTLDMLVDDWDLLFTDTDTKDNTGKHVPCRSLATRPNFCSEMLQTFLQRFYPISSDFSRIGMRYGAYSMIVRRSGMEKILKHFKSYGIFLPYDMDFWLVPDIKMYSVNQNIISHAVGALSDNAYPKYREKKQ